MKEKKVEVSICNSFFSKPPKNALKLKIQNPAIIRTAKKGFFYKCLRLRISATVSGVRNTKQMTSIIDYRFPSSTGQCVKLNFGEPCVAIVNSPYRNCFFVLGAGDRGASSCLFSSLCSVVSGNISPLFGQEGGGGHMLEISCCRRRHKRVFNCLHHYVRLGTRISVTLNGLPCFVPSYYVGEPDTFAALNNVENGTRVIVQ